MEIVLGIVIGLVFGIPTGVLIGRKNKQGVEKVVDKTKEKLNIK